MEMEENKKNFILIGNSAFAFTEDNTYISEMDLNCQGTSISQKQQNQTYNTITITALNGETVGQQIYQSYDLLPNLTLYLNKNQQANQWGNPSVENYPFFNSENPVDFPFLSSDPIAVNPPTCLDDVPEFIDVNNLVGREYQHCFLPGFSGNSLPMMNHEDVGELKDGDSSDDDVIFVKEYKKGDEVVEDKKVVPLRRNPKRQVQLQKAANNVLSHDSFEDLGDSPGLKKKNAGNNNKRSTKTTGAVLSPPSPLNTIELKEWPVDGMHEKPTFNPVTRKIVKHPNTTKKKPGPKPSGSRPKPKRKAVKKKPSTTEDFAKLTHNTLHHVLSYVEDVKEYNKLINNENDENLKQAKSLLLDSCILYCVSNDVSEAALGKYLKSFEETEDVSVRLKEFIDDIENGVCHEE